VFLVDLSVEIAGLRLKNPLMNAACPISRDAESMIELVNAGVAAVVAKTISVKPAIVPRPSMAVVDRGVFRGYVLRTLRPGDVRVEPVDSGNYRFIYAFLNAELWSDIPAEHYLEREYPVVSKYCEERGVVFIASIGYTPEELSLLGPRVERAGARAIEFSTHYIGRDHRPVLEAARALRESVSVPVFAKISPFTPNIPELVRDLERIGVDGVVATNTIGPALHIDVETGVPVVGGPYGFGWMSGPALKPLALAVVAQVALNSKLPVIGVGGVTRGVDVVEYIMAGASAVQICTAAIVEGPGVFRRVLSELEEWMKRHGYTSIYDFKGVALKHLKPESRRVWAEPPVIDEKKCIGCGFCELACTYRAIRVVEEGEKRKARVDITKCYGCGVCVTICPTRAVHFTEKQPLN